MSLSVRQIDPRDANWELEFPAYRVYFHDFAGASDEWRIADSPSVGEVVKWADEHAAGRTYLLYVEVQADGLGLVRLAGSDPNAT